MAERHRLVQEKARDFVRKRTLPQLHEVIQTLINAALGGDVRAALAILNYHAPPPKEARLYVDAPTLNKVPLEQRSEAIAALVIDGTMDLEIAERLTKITDTRIKQENTTKFMQFLRRIGQGEDPTAIARELAAAMAVENAREVH